MSAAWVAHERLHEIAEERASTPSETGRHDHRELGLLTGWRVGDGHPRGSLGVLANRNLRVVLADGVLRLRGEPRTGAAIDWL